MKAKIVRNDIEVARHWLRPEHEEQYEWRRERRSHRMVSVAYFKVGAVIEEPNCWHMVAAGSAMPADEECREAAGMTEEELQAAQVSYNRTAAGIWPEDFPLFDAGIIAGYIGGGDIGGGGYKPGPKYHLLKAAKAALKAGQPIPTELTPEAVAVTTAGAGEEDDDDA